MGRKRTKLSFKDMELPFRNSKLLFENMKLTFQGGNLVKRWEISVRIEKSCESVGKSREEWESLVKDGEV